MWYDIGRRAVDAVFRDLAEDIVFVLIMKKQLDIERRDAAIRRVTVILKAAFAVIAGGIMTVICFNLRG